MNEPLRLYIGHDPREDWAYRVAAASMRRHSSQPLAITPLHLSRLELSGIMRRPRKLLGTRAVRANGEGEGGPILWDEISDAPMSTEFAISRFCAPILAQTGWCAFFDCDVVALADLAELWALRNEHYAVMCVKHQHLSALSTGAFKMDGQPQTYYQRKNWSSVMLFNCDHPANRGLDLALLNTAPGRDLHRFCWLDDEWIGELPAAWNWLVGVNARPEHPKLAHFTLGGPWLPGWTPHVYDELWLSAAQGIGPGD